MKHEEVRDLMADAIFTAHRLFIEYCQQNRLPLDSDTEVCHTDIVKALGFEIARFIVSVRSIDEGKTSELRMLILDTVLQFIGAEISQLIREEPQIEISALERMFNFDAHNQNRGGSSS